MIASGFKIRGEPPALWCRKESLCSVLDPLSQNTCCLSPELPHISTINMWSGNSSSPEANRHVFKLQGENEKFRAV